ncbi:hemicentin-1-like [Mytilus californianus]|uniref:hemicentin-1-like n=1 Tax=Mytilus californianus TaxID=6549 RepID=UPI0022482359|nr:hemicentin-1-like [Mytilus californianus]
MYIVHIICIFHEGVVQGKLRLAINKTSYVTEFGSSVSLNCQIFEDKQFPTVHVIWNIYTNGKIAEKNVQQESPSLDITSATFENTGNYTCSAKDSQTYVTSQPIKLTVIGAIPTVKIARKSYKIHRGQNVTIECNITSTPNHTDVYWLKTSNGLSSKVKTHTQRVHGGTVAVPSLTILNTGTNDSRLYTCYAQNIVGTGSSEYTNLTVVGSFPVVSVGDRTVTAEYGHGIILECSITADPPVVTVYWQKENDGIKTNITSTTPGIDGITTNRPSLTIKETKDSDSGIYICCAINAVGLAQSNNINLTVEGNMNYPFVQLNPERSIQVKYGGTFSLKSYIRSNKQYPIREIYWQYINNGIVTRVDSKTGGNNIDNSSLTFMHVTTSESGQFTCFATNDVGTSKSNSIDVKVNGATPNIKVENTRYESVFGEMVELVCQISAEPPLTNVYWEKVANDTRMIINTGSVGYQNGTRVNPSLTIKYSTLFDTGNYTCLGSNSVGISRSESIFLHVTGDLPEVSVPILAVNVSFGDSVNLICNVTAKPLHDFVYWEHKETFATRRILTGTVGTEGSTVETPSLTLKYATNTMSGLYTCFARNAVGISKSSTIKLKVNGGLPEVVVDVRNYSTTYGKKIKLDCRVTAHPEVVFVYWQKEINNVITTLINGSIGTEGIELNFPSLVLTRPVTADSGIYMCFALNRAGIQQSVPTTLTVEGGIPHVTILHTEYTAEYGKPITMNCNVQSNPPTSRVFWQKVNDQSQIKRINNGTPGTVGSSVTFPSLIINFTTPANEGIYFCLAENTAGIGQSQRIKLTVLAGLPVVRLTSSSSKVLVGSKVEITCLIKSIPDVENVYWHIDSKISTTVINENSSNVNMKQLITNPTESMLTIQEASVSLSGKYRCFAKNEVGTSSSLPLDLTVIDTDTLDQTVRVIADFSDDDTDTIVQGVLGSIGTLVAIGSFFLTIVQIRKCKSKDGTKKCKITDIASWSMNKLTCPNLDTSRAVYLHCVFCFATT